MSGHPTVIGGLALGTGLPPTVSSMRAPSSLPSNTKSICEPAAGASAATAASASRLQTSLGPSSVCHITNFRTGEPRGSSVSCPQPSAATVATTSRQRSTGIQPLFITCRFAAREPPGEPVVVIILRA